MCLAVAQGGCLFASLNAQNPHLIRALALNGNLSLINALFPSI